MAHGTTAPMRARPAVDSPTTAVSGWLVAGAAVLAVVARLPFVAAPPGADEAGFLQVAAQWGPAGGSLYGHYWVDRPPVLIAMFQLAHAAGGLVALRLLGCLAVATTVLLCGRTAGRIAGRRAAPWAALAAAAMLVSPLLGSLEVNGELLAAPFVAASVAAIVESTCTRRRRRALVLAGAAGAAAVCAVLVKQNIGDGLLFGAVLLLAETRWRPTSALRARALAALGGAVLALVLASAWTGLHGTSLVGVFEAMYPFRLRAAGVVAAGGSQYASARGVNLLTAFAVSGAALLTATLLATTARRRAWEPAVLAVLACVGYDAISITLGGGYWLHYLVEGAVPLSVWAGVLVGRGAVAPRVAAVVVAVVSLVSLTSSTMQPSTSAGEQVGKAIARVARPGDTLTTLYGESQVNFAAGLPSPYEHLWSLPVKTLDPQLTGLDAVLSGSTAPTWLVISHSVASWGLSTASTQNLISTDYRVVAQIDGQTVYLHDGVYRAVPTTQEQP